MKQQWQWKDELIEMAISLKALIGSRYKYMLESFLGALFIYKREWIDKDMSQNVFQFQYFLIYIYIYIYIKILIYIYIYLYIYIM